MISKSLLACAGLAMLALALAHAPAATPAMAKAALDGAALFRKRCQACHSVVPGVAAVLAPNLAGVLDRKAAATAYRYSDALRKSGLTWSPANLDRYLAGPMRMVPGTRMVIRVSNPAERAAIIDHLARIGR